MVLPHLASRLFGTPLLLARAKLDVVLAVLGERIGLPAAAGPFPIPAASAPIAAPAGIAVIPIHGTLVRRSHGLEAASGLTAYSDLSHSLEAALADPQVRGVLLDVDSPGGEAGGVFELAERIRAAASIKPIWAHANDSAFSAAYALAAGAQRLTLSQTAGVGSIGVLALHVDQSVKDTKDGLTYTAITAGARKNDYSPHAPLAAGAAQALQTEVDRLYALFVRQVATHRSLDETTVRATDAGLFFAEDAVGARLADAVGSLDQVLAEFADSLRPATHACPLPFRSFALNDPLTPTEHAAAPEATVEPTLPGPVAASPTPPPAVATLTPDVTPNAQAIAELCLLAGAPQRTAEFLARGFDEAQVRRTLLDARATQVELSAHLPVDPPAAASPLLAAVQKLHA